MVRKTKSTEKSSDSTQTEANVEHALDAQEAESDAESNTESTVETNTGASATSTGADADPNSSDDGESVAKTNAAAASNTASKHSIVKGTRKRKGLLSDTASVLKDLAAAAASGVTGGVTEMIKSAIKNLQLKMSVATSSSSAQMQTLTRENNKNEVKFVGGDTAIDPNAGTAGGMSFESWKDSIKGDPAPIAKTLSPITELMVQFAGPNAGEQCEKNPSRRYRRRQMTECMTRKVLREGRALADTLYEIDQVEVKKAKLESQMTEGIKATGAAPSKELTQQWASLCKIRMTLLSKRDYQKLSLYQFTFTTPNDSGQAGAHNHGKVCDRELSAMTQGGMSKMVTSVTRKDLRTGRVIQDTCAMCMAMYDNAKCLTTQNECGENSENIKFVKVKSSLSNMLGEKQCRLNDAYKRPDGSVTGAMPEEVNTWLSSSTLKLDKSEWKGRNGWMGWSAVLFAEKRHLCHKVTNKLVCEQFVEKLRREFCLPEASNTIVNRQRNKLIAALDFGVKGVSADETTARDACECSNFCTPNVEIPDGGLASWVSDLWKKQSLMKTVLDKTVNKDYLAEMYRESLVQQDLMQCVSGRPLPRPILPAKLGKPWEKKIWDTVTPDDKMSCKEGDDVEPKLTGIFVNRVSYMGHCVDSKMCFESDYMNQGEPGRTLLETRPEADRDTPTLSVFDLSGEVTRDESNEFQAKQERKSRGDSAKEIVQFRAWGKSPESREYWTHKGVVYAELLKSPSTGMPKIIVVSSGIPKEPNAGAQITQWFKKNWQMTGHNLVDPRRVLEIEDRDGNDMCMFMYSLCCAMGGILKQDKEAADFAHLSQQCPAGTVCCPQTGRDEKAATATPVPWGPNTIRLLHVLSHGKLKGAPPMEMNDPSQGWISNDPISSTGPSMCVDAQALKDVFPDAAVESKSRTVERKKAEDGDNPNVICRFECMMKEKGKSRFSISKSAPCTDKSGRKIDVRVGPVPRNQCVLSSFDPSRLMKNSPMQNAAMQACKRFAENEGKGAGVHPTCGYKVKLISELAEKPENWTENMNDSMYRSAGGRGLKGAVSVRGMGALADGGKEEEESLRRKGSTESTTSEESVYPESSES